MMLMIPTKQEKVPTQIVEFFVLLRISDYEWTKFEENKHFFAMVFL